jgi:hypothetical protein
MINQVTRVLDNIKNGCCPPNNGANNRNAVIRDNSRDAFVPVISVRRLNAIDESSEHSSVENSQSSPTLIFQIDIGSSSIVDNSPINQPASTLTRQGVASLNLASLASNQTEELPVSSTTRSRPILIPKSTTTTSEKNTEAQPDNAKMDFLMSTIRMGHRIQRAGNNSDVVKHKLIETLLEYRDIQNNNN